MKRMIGIAAVMSILLAGCGGDNPESVKKELLELKNKANKIAAVQKKEQKQFKELYKHLKTINGQFPKLFSVLQKQVKTLQKSNESGLKRVEKGITNNINELNNQMNQFGFKLSESSQMKE